MTIKISGLIQRMQIAVTLYALELGNKDSKLAEPNLYEIIRRSNGYCTYDSNIECAETNVNTCSDCGLNPKAIKRNYIVE